MSRICWIMLQNMVIQWLFNIIMLKSPSKTYVHHWLTIWREHHVNVVSSHLKSYCVQILWIFEQCISNVLFSISDVWRIQGQHQGTAGPACLHYSAGEIFLMFYTPNIISKAATCIYLCIFLLHIFALLGTSFSTSIYLMFF